MGAMMKIALSIVGGMMLTLAAPAVAQTAYSFDTTGSSTVLNGTYGNVRTFATTTPSPLKLQVTAFQSNQATNAITSAYLGDYSGGLGVTGLGDANGANNLHQIDNLDGYTDFVLLEFSAPVVLTSIATNSYGLTVNGVSGVKDSDFAFYNAGAIVTPLWNSPVIFTTPIAPAAWTTVAGTGTSVTRTTGATVASTKWLVGAASLPTTDRNDGFKIAGINVSELLALPEPGTWAMMVMGFGALGVALRRDRRRSALAAA